MCGTDFRGTLTPLLSDMVREWNFNQIIDLLVQETFEYHAVENNNFKG